MKKTIGFCLIFTVAQICAGQTGDGFTITQSVISSGGRQSAGGGFIVGGTVGQTTAGTNSTGGSFNLRGGFWTFQQFAPTAAASISGRVFSGKGAGIIRRVRISLLDTSTGIERTTQTNPFGFYRFDELEVGRLYIIRAVSNKYTFTPDQHLLELLEDRENVNFTGSQIFLQN